MLQSSKLLSVFKPDTLSGVLTLFNDHNLLYSRTGPEDNITLTRVHQLKYLGYLKLMARATTDAIGRPSGEILVGLST